MGYTRSTAASWGAYSSSAQTQTQSFAQAYTNTGGIKDEYHPKNIGVRESRASVANPEPTPIIFALDCTGSMQDLALSAVKNIGTLMAETYDRLPVTDPQIMAMFFDDVLVSGAQALQATQFESDKIIVDQLKDLFFVYNGGGNGSESYSLPLHFAVNKTDCDAFNDGRKGFLFIMGDDGVPPPLTDRDLKAVYGPDARADGDLSFQGLLDAASENWHVFFIYPRAATTQGYANGVFQKWRDVLGERAIELTDVNKLAEVLVATMQVIQGADKATVAASFTDPGTSLVVAKAIDGLVPATTPGGNGGVARL